MQLMSSHLQQCSLERMYTHHTAECPPCIANYTVCVQSVCVCTDTDVVQALKKALGYFLVLVAFLVPLKVIPY